MIFDFDQLPGNARDKLLHSTVVPRPIAWVTSMDEAGVLNMAPFSFFNVFSASPPIVGFCVQPTASGMKDTARNILETKQFVVPRVSYGIREAMNITAAEFPAGIDEVRAAGLTTVASLKVKPPRIAESPVAMECELHQDVHIAPDRVLVLGRVVAMHIEDEMMEDPERYYVDTPKLDLIGRMHGRGWYARTNSLFKMDRLSVEEAHLAGAANE